MSKEPWRSALRRSLRRCARFGARPRVAIVGVGHELRGDDGAGPAVVRALARRLACSEWLSVVDGGPAPENQTGLLRRFGPDLVLFVDAALIGEAPGVARWVDLEEIDGLSASTHTLPLRVVGQYLSSELGCTVALLGIQPCTNAFDAPMSHEVTDAVRRIGDALIEELHVL